MRAGHSRSRSAQGFTVIEVMLVLGLTGFMIIGILVGTFSSISRQRYTDAVRSFAEYLRTNYSAALMPESNGAGNSKDYSILGKVLVIGHDYADKSDKNAIFSATLVGNPNVPYNITGDIIDELYTVNAEIYCGQTISGSAGESSVSRYELLWESHLNQVNDATHDPALSASKRFSGTVIIARMPSSGVIHTIYTSKTYDLLSACSSENTTASTAFQTDLKNFAEARLGESGEAATATAKFYAESIGFCIKSPQSDRMREVRIAADGRNTSAVSILDMDSEGGTRCED